MNQSTNYNFNLPEGTDLVNPLTQLIPNWSNLDTILKGVQDATFQNATETVALGVHAITRLNPDAKLLKWIATANFEAGDTFTIDGISTPAALPSGESLGDDAYIAGAVVIAALNADESALTVFVTSGAVAVASDSERLGGKLPSYYAKKTEVDDAQNTADAASIAIALKNLANVTYDTVTNKMYLIKPDGTQGGEIKMGDKPLNYTTPKHTFSPTFTYTVPSNIDDYVLKGSVMVGVTTITINGTPLFGNAGNATIGSWVPIEANLNAGDVVAVTSACPYLHVFEPL